MIYFTSPLPGSALSTLPGRCSLSDLSLKLPALSCQAHHDLSQHHDPGPALSLFYFYFGLVMGAMSKLCLLLFSIFFFFCAVVPPTCCTPLPPTPATHTHSPTRADRARVPEISSPAQHFVRLLTHSSHSSLSSPCCTALVSIHNVSKEVVAIKQINLEDSEEDISEIQQEIALLSQCDSEFITKYYGSCVKGFKLWIGNKNSPGLSTATC